LKRYLELEAVSCCLRDFSYTFQPWIPSDVRIVDIAALAGTNLNINFGDRRRPMIYRSFGQPLHVYVMSWGKGSGHIFFALLAVSEDARRTLERPRGSFAD